MASLEPESVRNQLKELLNEIEALSDDAASDPTGVEDPYLEWLLDVEMQKLRLFIGELDSPGVNLGIISLFLRTERDGIWDIKRRLLDLRTRGVPCLIRRQGILRAFSDFIVRLSDANGYAEPYRALEHIKDILDEELREIRTLGYPVIGVVLGVDGVKREPTFWVTGPTWPTEEEFRDAWGSHLES